jgi:hypothetical protein
VAPILIRFERFPVFHTFTSGGGNDFYFPIQTYAAIPVSVLSAFRFFSIFSAVSAINRVFNHPANPHSSAFKRI